MSQNETKNLAKIVEKKKNDDKIGIGEHVKGVVGFVLST